MVSWVATNRCDSKCVYCEARANESDPEELSTEEIKRVIDELDQLNVGRFFVIGGEPFMRRDLFDVLAYAKYRGMEIGIFTNSLRYKKFEKDIMTAGLHHIWTSIDGLKETHDKYRGRRGAYNITMEALKFYEKLDIPIRVVNTVVHPGNFHEMESLFKEVKASGATWWRLGAVMPVGRAMENEEFFLSGEKIKDLLQFAEECRGTFHVTISEEMGYLGQFEETVKEEPFYCHAGQTFCTIMPDGDIAPCQTDDGKHFAVGNVRQQSFKIIWQKGFKKFRSLKLPTECNDCEYKHACCGGCWIVRRNGSPCTKRVVGL
jgi:radical SAM protein with 4Fe4S-binding SPASM domain